MANKNICFYLLKILKGFNALLTFCIATEFQIYVFFSILYIKKMPSEEWQKI